MTVKLLTGDCRVTLATLLERSVQTVITSPPYWGLRDYGTEPLVWGGEPSHEHEWAESIARGQTAGLTAKQLTNPGSYHGGSRVGFCACGAWLGSLGLEPTPELFVEHIVEVFRAVRRVLRDDGTVWCNLGDSYAGSGKGPSNSIQASASQIGNRNGAQFAKGQAPTTWLSVPAGVKPKDLMMIPAMVAMALRADGWYLRSQIPWIKRNSMPESVSDRPATAVEYVFLFSKSSRYYFDADAVRQPLRESTIERGYAPSYMAGPSEKMASAPDEVRGKADWRTAENSYVPQNGRNRRNSDWFFESWQGLMLDDDDVPMALVVNPMPFKGSHFATFPPKLVEPMVKASTSERGGCPECGAPWVRVVEKGESAWSERRANGEPMRAGLDGLGSFDHMSGHELNRWKAEHPDKMMGWRPSCKHEGEPVPQTVLDCFGGAGSTGLVADRLGRNAILCELKPAYGDMAAGRLIGDAPMFVEFEGAEPVATDNVDDKQGALGKRTYSGFNEPLPRVPSLVEPAVPDLGPLFADGEVA